MSLSISVLCCISYKLFYDCLVVALSPHADLDLLGYVPDLDELMAQAKALRPQIVLLDTCFSAGRVVDLIRRMSQELPVMKVIALGLDESDPLVLRCIEAGAKGYVAKDQSVDALLNAISLIQRGETICSPRVAFTLFSRIAELAVDGHNELPAGVSRLTPREIEILQLISDGLSNNQIAQRLMLSLYTVKNHVHNILEKLETHSRNEAILLAARQGLLSRPQPLPAPAH